MRLHRILVPLVATVILAGLVLAIALALRGRAPRQAATTAQDSFAGQLLAIKNQAEELAIAGKLPEAHAKYRELFALAHRGQIKDSLLWDILERAKVDQDRIYAMILSQQEVPATRPAATSSTRTSTPGSSGYSRFDNSSPATMTMPTTAAVAPALSSTVPSAAATQPTAAAPATTQATRGLPQPSRFRIIPANQDAASFSDALIGQSLAQGAQFLLAQFKNGEIQAGKEVSEIHRQGLNALCVYALLAAGQANGEARLQITSPMMKDLVERMKRHPMSTDKNGPQQPVVYSRSLRAAALALYNRAEDRALLRDDVLWLVAAAQDGAYSYDDRFSIRIAPGDAPGAGRAATRPDDDAGKKKKRMGLESSGVYPPPAAGERPLRDEFGRPIQLADGLHDPRTGREITPTWLKRNYPPPPARYEPPQWPTEILPSYFTWDNSNSQYGVLGVWSGAQTGIEIADAYWAAVQKHWLDCQLATGEWTYRKDRLGGYLAMTCGGISSLMIAQDFLEAPMIAGAGRQPTATVQALAAAMAWLEQGDNAVTVTGPRTIYLGYNLHSLSRVGLISGYKFLGAHDWYRELAQKIVLSQWENGSWGRSDQPAADTLIDTAYTMLFLARGRHPILMNKLRLDESAAAPPKAPARARGEWNNRPRDLAHLAAFAGRELERPINWQIVSLDRPASDWFDAPILYLASHQAMRLNDADLSKLREFCLGGGMLFSQADANATSFNLFVEQLAAKLFPAYALKELTADHEIYTVQFQIPPGKRPRIKALGNGSRLLWVHCPTDLAVHWQQRAEKTRRESFEMGVNLFVYAAGKSDLRNRIDQRFLADSAGAPSYQTRLVRLKYPGEWDPEPQAMPRFARWLKRETGVEMAVTSADVSAIPPDARFAHLCGVDAWSPDGGQNKSLATFVESGGILLVEALGPADSGFAQSLQSTILPGAFPGVRLEAIGAEHPMLNASFAGMEDIWPPRLRTYARTKLDNAIPPIRMARYGKGRIIYLPLDISTGLLGCGAWSILGYEPAESLALMKNVVLWNLENPAAVK